SPREKPFPICTSERPELAEDYRALRIRGRLNARAHLRPAAPAGPRAGVVKRTIMPLNRNAWSGRQVQRSLNCGRAEARSARLDPTSPVCIILQQIENV